MAIAFDAATDLGFSALTTLTHAHTCTGANGVLFVGILGLETSDFVSGVTYNGVAMTRVAASPNDANQGEWLTLYMLVGPATGSNNVVITKSNAGGGTVAAAASYTGAGQTGNPENTANATSAAVTSLSASILTSTDNDWLIMAARINTTPTAGANTIIRAGMGGNNSAALYDSNGAKTPPGTYALAATFSSSIYKYTIAALKDTSVAGGLTPTRSLFFSQL